MDPRKDSFPFKPPEEWYESFWLRPEPGQSTGFSLTSGVMAFFQRIPRLVLQWPRFVHYRDETARGTETFPP
jgi:hypothetical protein